MSDTIRKFDIGIMYGEGIGYKVIEQTKKILAVIEKKYDMSFNYRTGPKNKPPGKNKRGSVNPIYSFCNYTLENKIPVISGPLSGGLVYSIRKRFDLFYKLIPLKSIPGYRTEVYKQDVDILLIRQNNAGEYYGKHGILKSNSNNRVAYQSIRYSEKDIWKIASVAFECASKRRQKVTLLLKKDGFPKISSLWQEVFQDRHKKSGDIKFEIMNVDCGAGELISNPSMFDVVATLNHDGDILCDAMVSFIYGSRGMGCSGNFNTDGFAIYQTVHGSAIDLVDKNKANPIAQILSSAMMLEYSFGLNKEAESIRKAIATVLSNGYRTEDIFQKGCKLVSTQEMCYNIAEAIFNS